MKNRNALENRTTRRILTFAYAAGLAVAVAVSLPQPAHADEVTPPPVPEGLEVDAVNEVFLVGHAVGTQNYVCVPSGAVFAWTLFTPEATLFGDNAKQTITHFFSPNPDEPNTNPRVVADGRIRAAWQHSRDTSTVWAGVALPEHSSTDSRFVRLGAIAWLKLTAVGAEEGPRGGDTLTKTTFIQRLNTVGGLAPSTGCSSPEDVGKQAFIPYRADYFFYTNPDAEEDAGN
jgi:hypothetical protein